MPGNRPVVLDDSWSFLQLQRTVESQQREMLSLRRRLANVSVRRHEAVWPPPAGTLKFASLTATLSQGGTATADVIEWDGDSFEYTGESITVQDWWFNSGESAEADTKIIAQQVGDTWIVTQFYCSVSDTLPA